MKVLQIIPHNSTVSPENLEVFSNNQFFLKVFDPIVFHFFDTLSKKILKDRRINLNPGLVALGFWLRKANIETIVKENIHLTSSKRYKLNPLGVVFHICPSNVDTMFLYSMALSLLTGNKNILRMSSKDESAEIGVLFELINEVLNTDEFSPIKEYLNVVKYDYNDEVSSYFSMHANARIIWGGDNTVKIFKNYPTKSRTKDIFFPDRTSCSLIKAEVFLKLNEEGKHNVVRNFYNDSYVFDQKGCSSPQIIFILGRDNENSVFEKEFYEMLKVYSSKQYQNDITSLASLKLNHIVADIFNEKLEVQEIIKNNNYLYFVEINDLTEEINSCGGGYFYIKKIEKISAIIPFIRTEVQTLTYFGLTSEECKEIETVSYGKGIDRIVPIGEALNFEYIWDGYNLVDELCQKKRVNIR